MPTDRPVRNPKAVLSALEAACAVLPSQRVAQVIVNALGSDPFYVEDDEAVALLRAYAVRHDPSGRGTDG